jgi:hypothetical protein
VHLVVLVGTVGGSPRQSGGTSSGDCATYDTIETCFIMTHGLLLHE